MLSTKGSAEYRPTCICVGCTVLAVNYLKAVVGPRTELKEAELFVERKVSNVHLAGA